MNPRKILVTGAGGFIGFQLGNDLAARGHTVIGVDRAYPTTLELPPFEAHASDFRDHSQMHTLLEGVDVVFHLASAHLDVSQDETEYWDVNVHSLRPLLETAMKRGATQFIHVSSVGVYGNLKTLPADEQTPCTPQSIYGETKLAGEKIVRRFTEETDFPTVILRPAWVYGPTCPRTQKLYRALRSRTFAMIGRGDNFRHPLYIQDLLDAFSHIMQDPPTPADTFILGGEEAITTRELIDTLCGIFAFKKPLIHLPLWAGTLIAGSVETGFGLLNKRPPISRRTLEFFQTNNAFDITKAKTKLGFTPRFSFEQGLAHAYKMLESYV